MRGAERREKSGGGAEAVGLRTAAGPSLARVRPWAAVASRRRLLSCRVSDQTEQIRMCKTTRAVRRVERSIHYTCILDHERR